MELFVNGSKLDVQLEDEKTVGDVLKAFEEECQKINTTTVAIQINGKNISADLFEEAAKEELKDDTIIELKTISQAAIEASFEEERKFCLKLADELKSVSIYLQSGKDNEANKLITSLADLIDNICHTASLSALFPDKFGNLLIDGKTLPDFFLDFSGILSELEKALETKDSVLTGDLAEYEISPRLEMLAKSLEV
ncbi:MAG: hypothetical protein J6J11_06575 [Treponema sp.]|nr:hypothetical protein [Treponema sp.]